MPTMPTTARPKRKRSESLLFNGEDRESHTNDAELEISKPQAHAIDDVPPTLQLLPTIDPTSSYINFSAPKRIKGRRVIDVTLERSSDAANRQPKPKGDHSQTLSEKPLSRKRKAAIQEERAAERRADIIAKLLVKDTTCVCCCQLPCKSNMEQDPERTSGNCLYDISPPIIERVITVGELRKRKAARDAYDDIQGRCICQEPSRDHPGHQCIMSKAGFSRANDIRQTVGFEIRGAIPKPINIDNISSSIAKELVYIRLRTGDFAA